MSKTLLRKELGDFQTPVRLALDCMKVLLASGHQWKRILEPTCGKGSFLQAAVKSCEGSVELFGLEIQDKYVEHSRSALERDANTGVVWQIEQGNIFHKDIKKLNWSSEGPLLVVGNPPWVTLSELGALGSDHTPERINVRSVAGFEAMTGESNFDVAEYIWMRLLTELQSEYPTVALLCKTSVARRVLTLAAHLKLNLCDAKLWRIDAKKEFNAAVDACLFAITIGGSAGDYECEVFESLHSKQPEGVMGIVDGTLVADTEAYYTSRQYVGKSPIEWRQGVKHDLVDIMELTFNGDSWRNRLGEKVDVEHEWTFPYLKSSDINCGRTPEKRVVVTQRTLADETQSLSYSAPRLWKYLQDHSDRFAARKSSIYKGRSNFAIFGIGPYSFAPWKVAVSGLHKTPQFHVLAPVDGEPVLVDDTSYFLPCKSSIDAAIVLSILRSKPAKNLIESLLFTDSKRPVTKKVLQKIDLQSILCSRRESIEIDAVSILLQIDKSNGQKMIRTAVDDLIRSWSAAKSSSTLF